MTDGVVVSTTVATWAEADQLAEALVTARLAACVQTHSIHSTYRWQGQVEKTPEVLLQIKTQRDKIAALMQWVQEQHSYALPELIVTAMEEASPAYLQWIRDETSV